MPVAPVALLVALGLLLGCWVFADPVGYAPDEPANYTKAVGVGSGQGLGSPGSYGIGPGFGPLQLQWINRASRVYVMPPGLAPDGLVCALFQDDVPNACQKRYVPPAQPAPRLTYVGTYEPFAYALAGWPAVHSRGGVFRAFYAGRLAQSLVSFVLLSLAVLVSWRRGSGSWSLLGLVVALPPMALFLAASISPNGLETVAAVCTVAAVLRLARPDSRSTVLAWTALAAGGAVLAATRSLGPVWLVLALGLLVALVGVRGALRLVGTGRRRAVPALGVLVLAAGSTAAWELSVQPHPAFDLSVSAKALPALYRAGPELLTEWVGKFGWADLPMPAAFYWVWVSLFLLVCLLAALLGTGRERLLLGGVLFVSLACVVVVEAGVIAQTHFPMYGRYVLPAVLTLPLVAGEIVRRHAARLFPPLRRALPVAVFAGAAAVQVAAVFVTARRYAVGTSGPWWFLPDSTWAPPRGWVLWLVTAALAAVLTAAAGTSTRNPSPTGATGARRPEEAAPLSAGARQSPMSMAGAPEPARADPAEGGTAHE
ncbi:MAG: DUF2142 domain-containing protein [Actinomycetota bacterium]|nr:DUF2142 domain-containing protein [Actinomycetota bacterium]